MSTAASFDPGVKIFLTAPKSRMLVGISGFLTSGNGVLILSISDVNPSLHLNHVVLCLNCQYDFSVPTGTDIISYSSMLSCVLASSCPLYPPPCLPCSVLFPVMTTALMLFRPLWKLKLFRHSFQPFPLL